MSLLESVSRLDSLQFPDVIVGVLDVKSLVEHNGEG